MLACAGSLLVAHPLLLTLLPVAVDRAHARSGKHGSISMGKLNSKQYASLDGDFHLDSSFASSLE